MHSLLLLGLLGLAEALKATPVRRYFTRRQDDQSEEPIIPTYNFSIPVDHFNKDDSRTYSNRFWMNDTYYESGGPVFFFDFGEQGVDALDISAVLAEAYGLQAIMQLAKTYHGMAIAWEHRYYGLSMPIPFVLENGTTVDPVTCASLPNKCTNEPLGGADGYKYHTVEQALEDVVYFAQNVALPGYSAEENDLLSARNTPWIFMGGSYPGCRAAWVRARNPETFYASWASSGPVEAMYDGSPYTDAIYRALSPTCAADVTAVIGYVDEVLDGKHGSDALQHLQELTFVLSATLSDLQASYNISEAIELSPFQVGEVLNQPLVAHFQNKPPKYTTDLFCKYMQSYNPNGKATNTTNVAMGVLTRAGNQTLSSQGVVGKYGVLEGLNAYAYASSTYLRKYPEVGGDNSTLIPNALADIKSWEWQALNQFGYIQGSNPDNVTIVSKYYNYTAVYEEEKTETFTFGPKFLPDQPDVGSLNKYGGWNMEVSNVMWTNGQYDPWRQFGVMSQQVDFGAPTRNITQKVPACNKVSDSTDVFGLLYPGAVHCPDLNQSPYYPMNGSAPVQLGLALFEQALDAWLPCFNSSKQHWRDWQ